MIFRKNIIVLLLVVASPFFLFCDYETQPESPTNPLGAKNITPGNGLNDECVHFSYDGSIMYYTTQEYIYDHYTWLWQYAGDPELHFWHLEYEDYVSAGQFPYLSPYNQYVAYSGVEWGGWDQDVYRFDAMNPAEHTPLTNLPWIYQAFAECWLHDSDYLLCLSDKDRAEPHGLSNPEIYLLHKDGDTPEHPMIRLTWTEEYECPHQPLISPDDQWVYYWHYHGNYPNQHSDLWKVKTDGSGERYQIDFPDTYGVVRIKDVSPDGRWLSLSRSLDEDEWATQWQICYIPVEGGEPRMFFEPISYAFGGPVFVPGYDLIAFISDLDYPGGETDIYVYPFNPDDETGALDFTEMERFQLDFNP